ncbi:hypothetical protein ACTHGU_10850 [Chitinophagaceae bacterium MMS25-I14]
MFYRTTLSQTLRSLCFIVLLVISATAAFAQESDHMQIMAGAGSGKFYKDDKGSTSFNVHFRKNWAVMSHLYIGAGVGLMAVQSEAHIWSAYNGTNGEYAYYNRYYTGFYAPLGAGYIYENKHTVFTAGADLTPIFYLSVNDQGHKSNIDGSERTAGWGVTPNICYTKKVTSGFAIGLKAFASYLQSPSKKYSGLGSSVIGAGIIFQF